MKYLPLIWAGLWRKPLRTTLTALSLVAAFMLFGLLQGINAGFTRLLDISRMDRLYVSPRFFDIQMPYAYKQKIENVPGVTIVALQSFLGGYYQDPKNFFFMGAADENFFAAFEEVDISKELLERLKNTRNAFVVSPVFANRLGLKVGDMVPVKSRTPKQDGSTDWSLELIGLVDNKNDRNVGQFSVGNYIYVNEERSVLKDTVSQFIVRIADPEQAVQIARTIDGMFANSGIPTRTQVDKLGTESNLSGLNDFKLFVNVTVVAVLFTLLLLTANTMMQSFRERIPEMAVLKTLGFSDRGVLLLVMGESLVQCMAGAAIGLGLARIISPFAKGKLPQPLHVIEVPISVVALGLLTALAVSIISAALPAWRASRLEIVDALAGR